MSEAYKPRGEVRNAIAKSVSIRAGKSTIGLSVELQYGSCVHQSLHRGFDWEDPRIGEFILRCCAVFGVKSWAEIEGKPVVCDSNQACVFGISPFLGGDWFAPEIQQ